MPWELEISTIDVGQGESSLIIAQDPAVAGAARAMLIDGGRPGYAATVHQYVAGRLAARGIAQLSHILVTHYDNDHTGGVMSLLSSDNLYGVVEVISNAAAAAAVAAINAGRNAAHQASAAGAAAAAAASGGYTRPGGNYAAIAVNAGAAAQVMALTPGNNQAGNAEEGADLGRQRALAAPAANLRLLQSPQSVRKAAVAAAAGVLGVGGTAAARSAAARPLVYNSIRLAVPFAVMTNGIYHNTHVIDIGDTNHVPDDYGQILVGRVQMWKNYATIPPGINRQRTSLAPANLGSEVLWNTGPAAVAAPANSPAAFLVACRKYVWNAPGGTCPIASGQPDNDDSIALVVRFGLFFFYTGGDLPTEGEDLVADAVMATGFADPQGGPAFAVPHRIAAFKCGHHGSDNSTSAHFLGTIHPMAALISCGRNRFGAGDHHPTQAVVTLLDANVNLFYLTNCLYFTNFIPASQGVNQLPVVGNWSRVCGDNNINNLAVPRNRGNIRLYLNQVESTAAMGPGRRFHVDYWDDDSPPMPAVGARTENQLY